MRLVPAQPRFFRHFSQLFGTGFAALLLVAPGCGGGTAGGGTGGAMGAAGSGAPGTAGNVGSTGSGGTAAGSAGTTGSSGSGGSSAGSAGNSGTAATGRGGAAGTGTGGGAGATARGGAGGAAGPAGAAGGNAGASGTAGAGGTSSPGNEFWVGPNGNDSNPGTQASPFKTITAAHGRVSAGGTIWLLSGTNMFNATQNISKSGTAAAPIRIQAVAGGTRPVLDFSAQSFGSSNRGLNVTGDYWVMRGFEIQNAGDNCIAVSGSNNTFDLLVIHGCSDTGLQITASSSDATNDAKAANNLVLN